VTYITDFSHISLFAYFFVTMTYVLGLARGPPGRCPRTTRSWQSLA